VTVFQQLQQEGTNPICRTCRPRMYLGEDRNGENIQPQVPIPSGI